jgi:hypothetical protein
VNAEGHIVHLDAENALLRHIDPKSGKLVHQETVQDTERLAVSTSDYAIVQRADPPCVMRIHSGAGRELARGKIVGPIVQSQTGERLAFVADGYVWVTTCTGERRFPLPHDARDAFVERFHEGETTVLIRENGENGRAWFMLES